MISKVVAKRYAKALFVVAKEDQKLEEYQTEFSAFAQLLSQIPELRDGLTNPVFPAEVRSRLLSEVTGALKLSPIITKFTNLLVEKRRVLSAVDISDIFQKLIDEHMGLKRAVVTAAVPVSAETTRRIQQALEQVTGKKVVLNVAEDPSIIGGLIVRAGDMVWDGSVRSQLSGLREIIMRGEGL